MSYIRLSLMKPQPGNEERVHHLLDDLVLLHESQPGYTVGYRIQREGGSGLTGRLAVWESSADAAHAAQGKEDFAIRAELTTLIETGSHEEHAYEANYAPKL